MTENEAKLEVMTAKEVAAFFKVSPGLIYELSKRGDIPHIYVGNELRFEKNAVIQAVFNR